MTWKQLLDQRKVQPHTTSKQEVDALRALIARDLQDAALTGEIFLTVGDRIRCLTPRIFIRKTRLAKTKGWLIRLQIMTAGS